MTFRRFLQRLLEIFASSPTDRYRDLQRLNSLGEPRHRVTAGVFVCGGCRRKHKTFSELIEHSRICRRVPQERRHGV